jgi:hypothetical protein
MFFDGRLRMLIIMATSEWGPMRLWEIERIAGRRYSSYRTSEAARYLEANGLVSIRSKNPINVTVGLDRRHPAFKEVQRFGKALYHLYLAPRASWTPRKRRNPISPIGPKHEIDALNMHVLGDDFRFRMLHLLAEVISCPAYVLVRSLGGSHACYETIRELERFGVVRTLSGSKLVGGKRTYSVRLDRAWPAHPALWNLLNKLNESMPEYGDLAAVYRYERVRRRHTFKWKVNNIRRARLFQARRIWSIYRKAGGSTTTSTVRGDERFGR